jgi:O-antigen/teichoic acid export membrane protein
MHILLGGIAAPAFVAAVFALALGLNPVRGAAWGAILGMAALACFAIQVSMADVWRFRPAWRGTALATVTGTSR